LPILALLSLLGLKTEAAPAQSRVGLISQSFISSAAVESQYRNLNFAQFEVFKDVDPEASQGISAALGLSVSAQNSLLNRYRITELSFLLSLKNPIDARVRIGRHRFDWSRIENQWNLGFFEPQFQGYSINGQAQGLTGFFLENHSGPMELTFFVSSVQIPNQGVSAKVESGRIEKVDPWFAQLPREIQVSSSNKIRRIDYEIQTPEISSFINQPQAALSAKFAPQGTGLSFSVSLARKKSNALIIGVDGYALADDTARVSLRPAWASENLVALDSVYRSGGFEFSLASIYQSQQAPKELIDRNLTFAVSEPQLINSLSAQIEVSRFRGLVLGLLRSGGRLDVQGPKSTEFANLFVDPIPYRQALALEGELNLSTPRTSVLARWTKGLDTQVDLININWKTRLLSAWELSAGVELIRASSTTPTPNVWASNETNDSLRLGAGYVF
jgi:hypothetical protein